MTSEYPCTAESTDAALVAGSLAGDREAFRQIVERHQTLVCSIAYCATGSLTLSEDLAQETFLAAWRQLPELRDPSKLRPWLCGIARFVVGKELRRQGREPVHDAEPLESVNELTTMELLPSERVINTEEQAILWHCVARVPEIYREPLVLFYRENQSIERVAEALELTEDAVAQRLARGRKLLQEQALAYMEGALRSTKPSHAFTIGVLAALPLAATPAKAATAGAAVKGSSAAKTVIGLATIGTILLFWSLLAFLAFVGDCAGFEMSRACARSSRQRENVIRFWKTIAVGFALFIVVPFLYQDFLFYLGFLGGCAGFAISWAFAKSSRQTGRIIRFWRIFAISFAVIFVIPYWCAAAISPDLESRFWERVFHYLPQFLGENGTKSLLNSLQWAVQPKLRFDLFWTLVIAALVIWIRGWWRDLDDDVAARQKPLRREKGRFVTWLSLGLVGPVGQLALVLGLMLCQTPGPETLPRAPDAEVHAEIQRILDGNKNAEWLPGLHTSYLAGTKTFSVRPWPNLRVSDPSIHWGSSEASIHEWVKEIITKNRAVGWTVDKDGTKALRLYPDGIGRLPFWAVENESLLREQDQSRVARPAIASHGGTREAWPLEWILPFFIAPMGMVTLLRLIGRRRWKTVSTGTVEISTRETSEPAGMLLALRGDQVVRRVFGITFAAVFLLGFSANAITAMGLNVVLFVGLVKGAFLGLVVGIAAVYLLTKRKASGGKI